MSTFRDLHLTTADYFAYLRGEASDRVTDICDEHRNDADFPWPDFLLMEGYEFIEGSVSVLSIIKLTKAQYDALSDTKEPADEQE